MRRLELILIRLAWFVPTLIGLLAIVFLITHVIPADPAAFVAGENATAETIAAVRTKLGLDRPLIIQFSRTSATSRQATWGEPLHPRPISEDLLSRLPATLELAIAAVLVASLIGIPLGVVRAPAQQPARPCPARPHRCRTCDPELLAGHPAAVPFRMRFGLAPLNGRIEGLGPETITGIITLDALLTGDWESLGSVLRHLALPSLTLALPATATIARFTRAGVLEVINSNYVLYERAMGLPGSLIIWKYFCETR